MRFAAYPKYKPSGVEWLGDVPEHWDVQRSDTRVTTAKRQVAPEEFAGTDVMHYSIPVVQETGTAALENGDEIASAKQLIDGPVVLVSRLNPRKATICRATPHRNLLTVASTEFVALKPTTGDIRFLEYLVSSELFRQRLDSWVQSVTRSHQRARPNEIYRFWNAWPERSEQRAIAEFLDRETAKIDTLVAKKRTLIERLKEKRTALISRTVTRGLPPDAARAAGLDPHPKLRPSGIDWLGDVPEHWGVRPLKRAVGFLEGPGIMASDFVDDGVPLLRISSIGGPKATLEGCNYLLEDRVAERWAHFRVRPGDLLISGSASTGFCSEVDDVAAGAIPYTGIIIIRPFTSLTAKTFVRWYFLSESFLVQAALARSGSTIQHFGPSHLSRMTVALPPLAEQVAIAEYLDRETSMLDAMIAKVETAIERLQEYRTAAVTGKIDVRPRTTDNAQATASAS